MWRWSPASRSGLRCSISAARSPRARPTRSSATPKSSLLTWAPRRRPMPNAFELLQSLINGLGVGPVYGLIAIGFCVIYNASGIVNFAQGVFVMLGGMFTHAMLIQLGWPLAISALVSIVLVAGV